MTAHDILHIKRLDISLRTGEKILNDVDLAIGPGRILGVIGESGAGKSMIGSASSWAVLMAARSAGKTVRSFMAISLTGTHVRRLNNAKRVAQRLRFRESDR